MRDLTETVTSAALTTTLVFAVMTDPCAIRAMSPVAIIAISLVCAGSLAACNKPEMWAAVVATVLGVTYHSRSCRETFAKGAPWRTTPPDFLPGPEPSVGAGVPESEGPPRRTELTTAELLEAAQTNIVSSG